MKKILALGAITLFSLSSCQNQKANAIQQQSEYIKEYKGDYLNRIAFPIGGMGAGMFCLEGTGAISNMSVRHQPNIFNEPCMFAAVHVKGYENGSKVLEGPSLIARSSVVQNQLWEALSLPGDYPDLKT